MLLRVTCEKFCAGAVVECDQVIAAAPVLAFTIGWKRERFVQHFRRRRGFSVDEVFTAPGEHDVRNARRAAQASRERDAGKFC